MTLYSRRIGVAPRRFQLPSGKLIAGETIIDFPNLGLTYNGNWCTATKLDETLISRPSREVNVNRERVRCYGAVYLSSYQMLE